jgi:pimeloyl-ACP methyl ester carboxylesterase
MTEITRSKTRVKGFENDEMDFQLMRQLGSTAYGGASVGESLSAATRITDGDPARWVDEFKKLAEWELSDAYKRSLKGHTVSARDQFLKACNSFRAAEYYSSPLDPLHRELGLKSRDCFSEAMKYVWHTFEVGMIPYKDIELPVYIMSPSPEEQKRKTILIVSGFDGTLEEEYLMRGYPALERGYNIVHYAGPGQMDLYRYFANSHFEPDYENVTKTVLDFISDRSEIDSDKIALMGISLGGYFSTRSAAHEPRIKALIPNSPILNLHDYLSAFIGYDPAEIPDDQNFTVEDISRIPDEAFPPEAKSRTASLIVRYGQPSFRDTFIYLREFVVGDAVKNIKCPSLALEGVGEGGEPEKQFNEFAEKVSGPVTKYQFTEFEGADTHCQVGNPSYAAAVALDWLDEVLD